MGVLRIETSGLFPYRAKHFGAMEWGHAHAVAEAIAWLSSEVLPAAIAQDHRPTVATQAALDDPDGGRRGD